MTPSFNVHPESGPPKAIHDLRPSHKQVIAVCNTARYRDNQGHLIGPPFPVGFAISTTLAIPRALPRPARKQEDAA